MLLDRFREAKAEEIALLTDMASRRELPHPWKGHRPDFLKAIAEPPAGQSVAVIAEFKQSSPSRGVIATGLKPEEVAEQYAAAGASCISVLTEEQFFGGRIGYLERMSRAGLPLLRKDFIFHQLQVMETASTPGFRPAAHRAPDAGRADAPHPEGTGGSLRHACRGGGF